MLDKLRSKFTGWFGWNDEDALTQQAYTVEDLQNNFAAERFGTQTPDWGLWTGEKFPGGFGPTQIFTLDYWEMRAKSAQLFHENIYARGVLRRQITNEISTGLNLEASPNSTILGINEDSLEDWSEDVENRFELWGSLPSICDFRGESNWAKIQATARLESLIEGDILVVVRMNNSTKAPSIQLISGRKVQTPLSSSTSIADGHKVIHGVELDRNGKQVAYWVSQDSGGAKRVAAFGTRGRRLSWLQYGTEKRMDNVRGEPLLAIIAQSLKELDRYRDSMLRKAVVNSMLAMFIKKNAERPGTLPIQGGAVKRGTDSTTDSDGKERTFNLTQHIPGFIIEELQYGEEPQAFKSDVEINYGAFEDAVIQAIAWSMEIPPEILQLAFSNNYSASQAAINEYKMYLNRIRSFFGSTFCQPVYTEWLLNETLLRSVSAPGFLEAWRNPNNYTTFAAWVFSDWSGAIKPSTDLVKQGKGYGMLIELGAITHDRTARETTGMKFSRNVKKLKRENKELVEAMRPIADFRAEYGEIADEIISAHASATGVDEIADLVMEKMEVEN